MNQHKFSLSLFILLLGVIVFFSFQEQEQSEVFQWKKIIYIDQYGSTHQDYEKLSPPFEVKAELELLTNQNSVASGLGLYLPGEYTLSWDGKPLESFWASHSLYHVLPVPDSLLHAGTHLVELKVNQFSAIQLLDYENIFDSDYAQLTIDSIEKLMRKDLIRSVYIHVLAGIFLAVGLYYLFLFWFHKTEYRFVVFAALCFCFFVLILAEYFVFHQLYHFDQHQIRLTIIRVFSWLAALLLPLFFQFRFHILPRYYWVFILVPIQVVLLFFSVGFDEQNKLLILSGTLFSLGMVVFALRQKATGSTEALYGVLAWLIAHFFITNYDLNLFLGFGMLIFFNLLSLSIQFRKQRLEYEQSLVRSGRLELELLKKNIQPHFLMNSLSSAVSWLQQNPKKGIELIIALSEELQQLIDISSLKKVPIEKEIELCRSFMRVMSFRKEIHYHLKVIGETDNVEIPPALILTLVENGITHGAQQLNKYVFVLNITKKEEELTVILQVPSVSQKRQYSEGTGTRYIKARLKESYGSNWSFEARGDGEFWETTIKYSAC